jgi:hypothetical protein
MTTNTETVFRDVDESTLETFQRIISTLALPFQISFRLINNEKQKKLIQVNKISEVYQFLTGHEILVIFNENYMDTLDEQSTEILIQQEMDRLNMDMNSGKIKIQKPELSTSVGVIRKYGIDDVAKANKLEELIKEQKDDKARDLANDIQEETWKKAQDDAGEEFLK